jgi:hypothetical protein
MQPHQPHHHQECRDDVDDVRPIRIHRQDEQDVQDERHALSMAARPPQRTRSEADTEVSSSLGPFLETIVASGEARGITQVGDSPATYGAGSMRIAFPTTCLVNN